LRGTIFTNAECVCKGGIGHRGSGIGKEEDFIYRIPLPSDPIP
jgi:hypothetical protein